MVAALALLTVAIPISAASAVPHTGDPDLGEITLDHTTLSLRFNYTGTGGAATAPGARAWGEDMDDTWNLTIATPCEALVHIEWFDAYASTKDTYALFVDGQPQGVNPVEPADGPGTTDVWLSVGTHTIVVDWIDSVTFPAPNLQSGGSYYDITFEVTEWDCVPDGRITSPSDGEILLVGDMLTLGAWYDDDDPNGVQWAVREGTCAAGTNTVAGNVDGFNTPYTFEETTYPRSVFDSSIDTAGWALGDYCFIFNPRETGHEPDMRLTQWFRIADGHINGGGQIIQEIPDEKKPYKVSFGGELWQFGSTVECDWTVQFHKVAVADVSGSKFHGTSCSVPGRFGGGDADGVTSFAVYGTLDGVDGYTLLMYMEDYSEPATSDVQYMSDTIRFELVEDAGHSALPNATGGFADVYDSSEIFGGEFPADSNNDGRARTILDRGNLQIDLR
jgi:hypothetical protein